jgi:hypothetical protein
LQQLAGTVLSGGEIFNFKMRLLYFFIKKGRSGKGSTENAGASLTLPHVVTSKNQDSFDHLPYLPGEGNETNTKTINNQQSTIGASGKQAKASNTGV